MRTEDSEQDADAKSDTFLGKPIQRLNLNLLYPLHAILHAPTLTEAGRQVCLSQSAMSHALKRLREHFGDDLVAFSGGERNLTPLGSALRAEVRRVMHEVEGTFNFSLDFDPLTADHAITIATPESIEQMLLGPVIRQLSVQAPVLSVKLIPLDLEAPQRALDQGAGLLLLPEDRALPRLETLPILVDHSSCMVWEEHEELHSSYDISEEEYLAARHVVAHGQAGDGLALDDAGDRIVKARRIAVQASSQATLPAIVIGSDLVATGSAWLFQYYANIMPLRVLTAPFATRNTMLVAQWANHRRRDPMLSWIVKRLQEHAERLVPNLPDSP